MHERNEDGASGLSRFESDSYTQNPTWSGWSELDVEHSDVFISANKLTTTLFLATSVNALHWQYAALAMCCTGNVLHWQCTAAGMC
jgi:hypothetical protein